MSGISSNEKKSKHKGMLNWNLFLIVVILFEFLIFGAANQKFLNISSMFRSMNDFVPIGIIGIFVTLVMITGGIDIQAGSIVGLTSIIIGVAWQDGKMFGHPYGIRMNLASPLSQIKEAFRRLDTYIFHIHN